MEETEWLIARELPRLRRYARALRNDAAADDLVQDCVERALRKSMLWQRGTNMRAWLFRILYNVHLSTLRRARRQPQTVPIDEFNTASSRGGQIARIELSELERALGELPGDQREVVSLVALEGMRYEEVAAVLDVPVGTVRSRLSRARSALRAALVGRITAGEEVRPHLRRVK